IGRRMNMINEALEGLREIAERSGCAHIMDNIDITMDVVRRSSDEDEKSISALAFSFFADYAIDRRNIDILRQIYELAGKLELLEEFQSRKAYEIIYSLRDELLNVYPKGLEELISFMESLESEKLDYRIIPYDPGNSLVVE
ncbi:MAG TPA: hypothetical protein VN580_13430, partial [Clostridia bacterium]|nr:hypothetical protein [Clostridia bacterium]